MHRYNKEVYAVLYDKNNPLDYVHMWHSHRGEEKYREVLGQGNFGIVAKKGEQKAVKTFSPRLKIPTKWKETNQRILEQKFFLKKNNIEEYFVFGLWSVKVNKQSKKEETFFYMPLISRDTPKGFNFNKETRDTLFEEFIIALKKLNDLGYAHPDLANNVNHISPQNLLQTAKGVRLIDLDESLISDKDFSSSQPNEERRYNIRDQWIFVYNNKRAGNFAPKGINWQTELIKWYDKNKGKSLSDNPQALFNLYKRGIISLPKSVVSVMVKDMNVIHLNNLKTSVTEYQSGSTKKRTHRFHEVSVDDFCGLKSKEYKIEYSSLKGDDLKRVILSHLKDSLKDVNTIEDLNEIKSNFINSPEMKIIETAQGITTHVKIFI